MSAYEYDPLYVAMSQAADGLDKAYRAMESAESAMRTEAVWLADHIADGGDSTETAWCVKRYKARRVKRGDAADAYKAATTTREATYEAWQAAGCPVSVGKPTRPVPAVTS